MDHEGTRGLFRHHLFFLAYGDADPGTFHKVAEQMVLPEVRTGWVAEAVAAAPVFLNHEVGDSFSVFLGNSQFLANDEVPVFGESLRRFHRQAVKKQVVFVAVGRVELGAVVGRMDADGANMEGDEVETLILR